MDLSLSSYIIQLGNNPFLWVITALIASVIFVNGLNDAPNSITTCVATRSLSPKKALVMAAIFSFLGVFIMSFVSTAVAKTVYSIADFGGNSHNALIALCAAMIAIVVWSVFAWKLGIPTSQSHALIAGITGANIAILNNFSGVNFRAWEKVLLGLGISTVLGFSLGFLISRLIEKICQNIEFKMAQPSSNDTTKRLHRKLKFIKRIFIMLIIYHIYDHCSTKQILKHVHTKPTSLSIF